MLRDSRFAPDGISPAAIAPALGFRRLVALGVALFLPFVALARTRVSLSDLPGSLVEKAL